MSSRDYYIRLFALMDRSARWDFEASWPDIEEAIRRADSGYEGEVRLTHPAFSGWLHLHLQPNQGVRGLLDVPLDPRFIIAVDDAETGFISQLSNAYCRVAERHTTTPYVEPIRSPSTAAELVIPSDFHDRTVTGAAQDIEHISIAIQQLNTSLQSLIQNA
jgi:hypothetical protein